MLVPPEGAQLWRPLLSMELLLPFSTFLYYFPLTVQEETHTGLP